MTTAAGPRELTTTETAAALRKRLRLLWPDTKFSVRKERGTAAGWLDVQWTDGPSGRQVKEVGEKFCSSWHDGDGVYRPQDSTELVSLKAGELPELVAYRARGIAPARRLSPEALAYAAAITGHTGTLERGQTIAGAGHQMTAPYPDTTEGEAYRLWLRDVDLTGVSY